MNGLMILIPVALLLGVAGLAAFLWSLRSGQYDDLDGAAVRILREDQKTEVISPRAGSAISDDRSPTAGISAPESSASSS
jgi:cbb3-type cytochrome oxidase maturation protein